MYETLLHIYTNYSYLGYPIISVFALVEGPVITVMLGSIVKLGYLNFFLVYFAVMLGDIIGDTFLYYLGYRYGDKSIQKVKHRFDIKEYHIEKVKNMFHKNKYLILFTSKITNGFGFSLVVLLTAGIVRIPFILYFFVNLVAQFIWSGALLFLGYHFVGLYQKIDSVTGKRWYIVIFLLVGVGVYLFKNKKIFNK
jgi:membrane protein DedA with SNARE-associated domain